MGFKIVHRCYGWQALRGVNLLIRSDRKYHSTLATSFSCENKAELDFSFVINDFWLHRNEEKVSVVQVKGLI